MTTRTASGIRWVPFAVLLVFLVMVPGGHSDSDGDHHGEEHTNILASEPYRIVNFVLLVGILVFLVRSRIASFLRTRHEGIRSRFEDARREQETAGEQLHTAESQHSALDDESHRLEAEFAERRRIRVAAISSATQREIDLLQSGVQYKLEQANRTMRGTLSSSLLAQAVADLQADLAAGVDTQLQARLVDQFLAELDREPEA